MYSPPWLNSKISRNVYQCSACLVKKGLMRVMRQMSYEAINFRDAPDNTPPKLICFANVGLGTYRSERCFLHSNITTLWSIQNLSHRASSN